MTGKIVKRNANAALVNMGECGYWVVAKMENGKRIRLFAGDTIEHGNRVYNWYRG